MKRLLLSALFISLLHSNSHAQIKFESGYFINDHGDTVNCLIRNVDWNYNPTKFNYKISDSSQIQSAAITTVSEFGIDHILKYKRFIVGIDRSSEVLNYMTDYYEPKFNKEQLFLKVLIEGKATLYQYESANLVRFFFNTDSSTPKQLVHKTYYTSANSSVENSTTGENNTYKQQLLNSLKGDRVSEEDVNYTNYNKSDLLKIFNKYDNDPQSGSVTYVPQKAKRNIFAITIRPGIDFSNVTLSEQSLGHIDMGQTTNIRIGIEGEYTFPFYKNKLSFIVEPTFRQYKNDLTITPDSIASISYKEIEVPIGIRYYLFLNNKSKLYINALVGFSFRFDPYIHIGSNYVLSTRSDYNAVGGIGYKYNNRFNIEARYSASADLLWGLTSWRGYYNAFSIIVGYTIFKK